MEWTMENTAIFIIALPFLILLGMLLVPVIFGLLAVAGVALVAVVNFILLPFGMLIGAINKERYRRAAKRDWDELQQWCSNNEDAIEFARKNPGGIYEPKGDDK